MSEQHDNSLRDKPLEFLQGIANTGGWCDGQAIIPDGDGYKCWCSCGNWSVRAPSTAEGLRAARVHTGTIPARPPGPTCPPAAGRDRARTPRSA